MWKKLRSRPRKGRRSRKQREPLEGVYCAGNSFDANLAVPAYMHVPWETLRGFPFRLDGFRPHTVA